MTHIAIASALTLVLTIVLSPRVSVAEVWECSQPNETTLYTNEPQEAGCQKFEPVNELIYLPPRIWPDPPTPEAADENQPLNQPEAQTASVEDEQTIPPSSEGESYNSRENSFWSSEENRIYTWVYTYTPRFYGMRPPRPRHHIPFRQASPGTGRRDFRESSVQRGVPPVLPQSVAPKPSDPRPHRERLGRGKPPTHLESVSPNVSRQSHATPDRAPTQAARSQSPRVSQQMKRNP